MIRGERRPLIALVVAYLILAVTYSIVVPLFEAPDEVWHYEYIRWLAQGKGLAAPEDVGVAPWAQQGSQPPLYYLLGAAATAFVPTGNAVDAIRFNAHAAVGDADAFGNKNMLLHGRADAWPWQGVTLAAHLARLMSVLLGAATVLFTFATARVVLSGWPGAALLAAAIVAFSPQFLFISASVNNDNLVTAVSAAGIYLCARLVAGRRAPPAWAWLVLGVLTGFAALSKLSGLLLSALAGVTVLAVAWQVRTWRIVWGGGARVAAAAVAVAGWWYVRNWLLFNDPLLLSVMFAGVPPQPEPASLAELAALAPGVWRSLWGVFGWFNVLAAPWFYWLYTLLAVAAAAGWLAGWLWRRAQMRAAVEAWALLLLLLWLLLVGVAVVRWAQISYAQGRLLFPALPALAVLLAGGLWAGTPVRWRALATTGLACGLAIIAAAAPFLWILPAYPPPRLLASAAAPHNLAVQFEDGIRLIGATLEAGEVQPGATLDVTLFWLATGTPSADYSVFVHAVDDSGIVQAQHDSHPGLGSYPTREWRAGEIIVDPHRLRLPAGAPAPASLRIEAGLYSVATGVRLTSDHGAALAVGNVQVLAADDALPGATRVNFDDKMALVGFALERRTIRPGETLPITLWWEALAPMTQDYVVFVHLLLPPDAVWAQQDQMPQGGAARTSTWRVGDRVKDVYTLQAPPDAPPGIYRIEIGVYDKDTFARLPVNFNDQGIVLAQVRVVP